MSMFTGTAPPQRMGSSLIEMLLLISITGALMLLTVRVLHLATQVHESAIRTATHVRLVTSLEDRLHSDIAKAQSASSPSDNELLLVMHDASQVRYRLTKPNLIERSTLTPSSDKHVTNQRWLFTFNLQMSIRLEPKAQQTLVRMRFGHVTKESPARMLRGIEVSEVTHAP